MIQQSHYYSIPSQFHRLEERHNTETIRVDLCGMSLVVDRGVYQTSGDSELMVESVDIGKTESFLEIGCGTGVVSLALACRSAGGIGVDINELAVESSKKNALAQKRKNVEFLVSDVFEDVEGMFDVVVCNPPYTKHPVRDNIDRMFWDPEDEMKHRFFEEIGGYLKPDGRIYFGWANFADIDVELPLKLAQSNGYKLTRTFQKPHRNKFTFYVFEFKRVKF